MHEQYEFDRIEDDLYLHMVSHFEDVHEAGILLMEVQYERIEWEDYYQAS